MKKIAIISMSLFVLFMPKIVLASINWNAKNQQGKIKSLLWIDRKNENLSSRVWAISSH